MNKFQIEYKGRLLFFRNDVNSFTPTQLSSKFLYSYDFEKFKIFIEHYCENTINYKPYDIKRFDIVGLKYKSFSIGWTFNKRYVDYEFWFIYEFFYLLFKGSLYLGINENFKKFYPFISIWILNISGFETIFNPNSADTLNLGEIPTENPMRLLLFGADIGLKSISGKFEINKFIPINDYIYNFNYKYSVDFSLKEKLLFKTYLEANSITQLIYPKWLILQARVLFRNFGLGLSELYTTNIRYDDLILRRKEYFLNFYKSFGILEFDFKYRFVKSDSLNNLYLNVSFNIQKFNLFLSPKLEIFNRDADVYVGIYYKQFTIYYLRKFKNKRSFDYFANSEELFGISVILQ